MDDRVAHAPDVTALVGVYRRPLQPPSPRVKRILAGVAVVLVAAQVFRIASAFADDVGDGLLALLGALLSPVAVVVALVLVQLRCPPMTTVGAEGLRVRQELSRVRSVVWAEVVAVGPPGRFDDHPVAVLNDGTRLGLPGLPLAVAEGLQGALGGEPQPARRQWQPPEQQDGDLDGPFRRGSGRRSGTG